MVTLTQCSLKDASVSSFELSPRGNSVGTGFFFGTAITILTRMAFSRAHSSVMSADVAKLLLLNRRRANSYTHAEYFAGSVSALTYPTLPYPNLTLTLTLMLT